MLLFAALSLHAVGLQGSAMGSESPASTAHHGIHGFKTSLGQFLLIAFGSVVSRWLCPLCECEEPPDSCWTWPLPRNADQPGLIKHEKSCKADSEDPAVNLLMGKHWSPEHLNPFIIWHKGQCDKSDWASMYLSICVATPKTESCTLIWILDSIF